MAERNLAEVVKHYLICALWSSTECDEDGGNCAPLDDNYGVEDIHPDTLKQAEEDCADFIAVTGSIDSSAWTDEQFGHDFWLTRCGHGAGFWDRGHGDVGQELTKWAKVANNVDLYIGDDGKVHSG